MGKQHDTTAAAAGAGRTFKVVAPKPKDGGPPLSGPHAKGLEFKDGVATTKDGIRAHAMLEDDFEVLDAATNKPAWPADAGKK